MLMKLSLPVLCAGIVGLSACTWVEPTKEGKEVLLVKAFNVQTCQHIGSTTSTVKHAIGPVTRSEEKVTEELITLAKNHAAERGGDSIVAKGPLVNGSMSFDIFRCGE
jgi:hypothetical protein